MCVHASEKVMRALPAFIRLWIGSLCAHALQFLHLHYAWFVRGLCICAKLVQTRALLSCCLCEYFVVIGILGTLSRRFFRRFSHA